MSNIFYLALLINIISISKSFYGENFFLKYQKRKIMRALENSKSEKNVKCFYIEKKTYRVFSIYNYHKTEE